MKQRSRRSVSISIEIERASGVAVVSCTGVLRFDDALDAAKELWLRPDWRGKSAVWEFRAARFDVTLFELRRIAKFILENQRDEPPGKVAFVTPRDVDFGLARMFQVFRDDPRTAFRVFRDLDAAIVWARKVEPGAG